MTRNKKYILIELFFLVIPILLSCINAQYSSISQFSWGYDRINTISISALLIAILGNLYIYWQNKKSIVPSRLWKTTSLILIVILAVYLYVGNSLSNFGF